MEENPQEDLEIEEGQIEEPDTPVNLDDQMQEDFDPDAILEMDDEDENPDEMESQMEL